MRKCRRNTIIIKNEIDIDKLAEAIVKVQKNNAEKETSIDDNLENLPLLKKVDKLLFKKRNGGNACTTSVLSVITALGLRLISFVLCAVAIILICMAVKYISLSASFFVKALLGLIFLISLVATLLSARMFWQAGSEINNAKDSNYIANIFSGLMGFFAIIIAIIAILSDSSNEIIEILKNIESLLQ